MEDFRKNYVLLSKIAKEKKYAQEYLGLLARRGDVGSIRIGKRWYTTKEWFSEFLRDAEMRKAEAKSAEAKIELVEDKIAEKVELRRRRNDENKFEVEEKFVPLKFMAVPLSKERKFETIDLRMIGARKFPVLQKNPAEKINGGDKRIEKYAWQNATGQEKMIQEWKIRSESSSPNFADSIPRINLFQKFAFSMAVVLILILLFQVGLVYKDEVKKLTRLDSARLAGFKPGIVAGAESTKLNLTVVKNSSLGYLGNQVDKVKENVSLSRVLIRAAMERNSNQ